MTRSSSDYVICGVTWHLTSLAFLYPTWQYVPPTTCREVKPPSQTLSLAVRLAFRKSQEPNHRYAFPIFPTGTVSG